VNLPVIAADYINELLYPFSTSSLVLGQVHRVEHLGLLDQIENTVTGSQVGGQVFRSAYSSKPAGRLDCIDFLARVERQSRELATELRIDTRGLPLRPRLRSLSVALGTESHHVVRSWWATARVLTQHDSPPMGLRAFCPSCDMFGTIRFRADPNLAVCVACGGTWTDEDAAFGRLAVWIQWSNEHLRPPHETCSECAGERTNREERRIAKVQQTQGNQRPCVLALTAFHWSKIEPV
jgi:hypothetical protein